MRIALLADLHANRDAVEACLADAESQGAEHFVFLGDLVGYGPEPGWVVDMVRARVEAGDAVAILGNHDAAALVQPRQGAHAATRPGGGMNPDAQAAVSWTASRLDNAQRAFLAGLPLSVEAHDSLYVHANAWAPGAWEYVLGELDAGRSMRATRCRLSFIGHVHQPGLFHLRADGRVGSFVPVPGEPIPLTPTRRWLAIPGSAGQPRDGDPSACWAMHDVEAGTLCFHRVPYDHLAAAARVREAGLPERLAARLERGR